MQPAAAMSLQPARTPLYDLHAELGAKMVPFAGYDMPVQYPAGILKEHLHTRASAGFFDISHMGQIRLTGGADIRARLESVIPGDIEALAPGGIRYSFLLNEKGGVLDDIMVTRPIAPDEQHTLFLIVNASGREQDFAYLKKHLPGVEVKRLDERALVALQGPKAAGVLGRFCDAPSKLRFMQAGVFTIRDAGVCFISRSGYTGEDGFEISVPGEAVEKFTRALLRQPEVMPIGLGARDSLRLEAGLCLYGHDLDPETTPIEADLLWAISKRRRVGGGFMGAALIQQQIAGGVTKKRVGIKPEGRVLARDGTEIFDAAGRKIGLVTSGGFGPSVDGPVAMGYIETAAAVIGTKISLMVRGKPLPAAVVSLPFVPHRYIKG
jgi:aminomethyltransferase